MKLLQTKSGFGCLQICRLVSGRQKDSIAQVPAAQVLIKTSAFGMRVAGSLIS